MSKNNSRNHIGTPIQSQIENPHPIKQSRAMQRRADRPHDVHLLPLVIADGDPVLRQVNGLADNSHLPRKRALLARQRDKDSRVGEGQGRG